MCRNETGTILRPEDSQNAWYSTIIIRKLRTEHHLEVRDSVLPINFGGVAALANAQDLSRLSDPHAAGLDRLLTTEPIVA